MKDKTKDIQPVQENIPQAELLPIGNTGQTLQKAKETAQLLKHIVEKAHLVIKIGASEHLRFEAWQFLGAAYGFTPKIIKTWWDDNAAYAEAVVIRLSDGMEVSKAVASCSKSERNWRNKDKFQIMSMAQTRAASKALRMVLSWVVVLAGYNPTPAEEMIEEAEVVDKATYEQRKKIFATAKEKGIEETELRAMILDKFGTEHTTELTKRQASELIDMLQQKKKNEEAEDVEYTAGRDDIVTDEKLKVEIRRLQNQLEWNDETLEATIRLIIAQDADLNHLHDAEAKKLIERMQGILNTSDKLL